MINPPKGVRTYVSANIDWPYPSRGLVLMVAASLALAVANSRFASAYFDALHLYIGPLNDALMAVFFLLVGLQTRDARRPAIELEPTHSARGPRRQAA